MKGWRPRDDWEWWFISAAILYLLWHNARG